jgi:NAD(P)-dependent dehydrogenase (short-subunit alcohol dehydrogenase family)
MDNHKIFQNSLLRGQFLLITGGGTGIGLETALQAAQIGASGIAICGIVFNFSYF